MSAREPELELEARMIAALRADLPARRDRERIRARLLSAGVAVSAGAAVGAAATTAQAAALAGGGALEGAGAVAGGKLAGLSLAAKIGWSAAVIATASTLSLAPQWHAREPARSERPVAARARSAEREPTAPRRRLASTPAALPAEPPAVEIAQPPIGKTSGEPVADLVKPLQQADAQAAAPAAATLQEQRAPAPTPSALREEAELIARALSALHAGERAAARGWLAEHAQRFPNGALRRERERAYRHLESSSPTARPASNSKGDAP